MVTGELDAAGKSPRTSWLRAVFSRTALRNLGIWTLVEFAFVCLLLSMVALSPVNDKFDWHGFHVMVALSGLSFILRLVIVVLPSAIISVWRLKWVPPCRMSYVPYVGTFVCLIALIPLFGVLFILILVPQVAATVVLHVLMARHYRRNIEPLRAS